MKFVVNSLKLQCGKENESERMTSMYEVELKARVDDFEFIKSKLEEMYDYKGKIHKFDSYMRRKGDKDIINKVFRIRIDNEGAVVGYKDKKRQRGVEINIENEFGVTDPDLFIQLMEKMGFEVYVEKEKKGFLFKDSDISIELLNIKGLGNFIEIEKILKNPNDSEIAKAEIEIREILERVGINKEKIESRYYIEMLLGK